MSTALTTSGEVVLLVVRAPEPTQDRQAEGQRGRVRIDVPKIAGLEELDVKGKFVVAFVQTTEATRGNAMGTRFAVQQGLQGKEPAALVFAQQAALNGGLRSPRSGGGRGAGNPALAGGRRLPPDVTFGGKDFETLLQMSVAGARRRPIVVVIEDLHWVDRTSEEFLASLVDHLGAEPILLVGTYRPGYQPPWAGRSYTTQLSLPRLAHSDSQELVRALLPSAVADRAEVVVRRGEGNPFFLEELARTVHRDDGAKEEKVAGAIRPAEDLLGRTRRRVERAQERLAVTKPPRSFRSGVWGFPWYAANLETWLTLAALAVLDGVLVRGLLGIGF